MKYKSLLYISAASIAFTSCIEKAYYVNPGYGNAMPYHTLPLTKDSNRNQLYLNASIMNGASNYNYNDEQYAVNANIYNTNSFSKVKVWYGAGITLGAYDVNPVYQDYYDSSSNALNNLAGNKFYGSLNGNAGITYALQLGNLEWRVLGVEASVQQEFGNFYHFRQQVAKQMIPVDGNVTDGFLLTTGLSTEFCIKIRNGSFNIFQQYNILNGKNYKYLVTESQPDYPYESQRTYRYQYWSSTYSVTVKNMTYFLQQNLGIQNTGQQTSDGPRMYNVQAGINYRFTHTKKR